MLSWLYFVSLFTPMNKFVATLYANCLVSQEINKKPFQDNNTA
jgi:hypothetical protein